MIEIESSDSILIVFSDGSAWSIFENISCEIIARRASKTKFKNLIGGQVIQLSQNAILNLRPDKASELYTFIDKKLTLIGLEKMKLASITETKQLADGQMHLLKSEGDSTLQGFESTYSFKEDGKMNLPQHTMIQSMNWLKGAQGEKIILSGTNMPVTILSLTSV